MPLPYVQQVKGLSSLIAKYRGRSFRWPRVGLIVVILIPLPTPVMDFLLMISITLSGVVLLTVMYIDGPLQFSSFPSLLWDLRCSVWCLTWPRRGWY